MKTKILVTLLVLFSFGLSAQVAINTTGASPDSSAALDVTSTTKGMLIPRMTTAQRTAISSPATGLLVYDNTTGGFWFYNGTAWVDLSASSTTVPEIVDADADTKIQVEETADDDIIRFDMAGTEFFRMDNGRFKVLNTGESVFIGEGAGTNDDLIGNYNAFIGFHAGNANTTGMYNTASGSYALQNTTTGNNNTASGSSALLLNVTGTNNTALGKGADVTTGNLTNATAIGYNAKVATSNSLVLGGTGSNAVNVGIGTTSPTELLTLAGTSGTDGILFPDNTLQPTAFTSAAVGNISEVLTQGNNAGGLDIINLDTVTATAFIGDGAGLTNLNVQDADADTKIQVEETADEDMIRFDVAGTEALIIDSTGNIGIGTSSPTELLTLVGTSGTDGILFPDSTLQTTAYTTGGNTLDEAYDQGRIITADSGALRINGEDGFLVTGTYGSGEAIEVGGAGTRMFFNPKKAAFRAGTVTGTHWNDNNIGNYSTAVGINTMASGYASTAMGDSTTASGSKSTAMGIGTSATGDYSTAMGNSSAAKGLNSVAIGFNVGASGFSSLAMGNGTNATGNVSTAMGESTTASGISSMAMGESTTASGDYSTAMGYSTTSSGDYSVAMGKNTTASGDYSMAMGENIIASSGYETVIGQYNTSYTPVSSTGWNTADRLFVVGNGTAPGYTSNALTILKNGNIGIGTDSPSELLHLSGTSGTDGILFPDSTLQTTAFMGALTDTDNDTKIQVEESADEDIIRFDMAGAEYFRMDNGRFEVVNTGGSVFIGEGAGAVDDLTSNNNVFVGYYTGNSNTTGYHNTASGYYALYSNIDGDRNTANGLKALYSNTTGNGNTANGFQALYANTTGDNNTALGLKAFYFGNAYSNSTALGYNTVISASNQVRIGNSSVTSIGGYAGWTNLSDGRFKTNVQENVGGLDFILKLRPVTYNLDMDALARFNNTPDSLRLSKGEQLKAAELQSGFIAQEVEAAANAVGYDFHGVDKPKNETSHYGLRYAEFVVPLVKAVQELNEKLEKENKEIKARLDRLEKLIRK